jgi:hypothetical protein
MNTWNYRVLKFKNGSGGTEVGIFEVIYNDIGDIISWTSNSITPTCETVEDLEFELELIKSAFNKSVLDIEELEKK